MTRFITPEPFPQDTLHPTLKPVSVPIGCYAIEVVQQWRGEISRGTPNPLRWVITVCTSPGYGDIHEVVGGVHTPYMAKHRINVPLPTTLDHDWRGSHVVGYVAPNWMDALRKRIAEIPILPDNPEWNGQTWVYQILREFTIPGALYADENMTFGHLRGQMDYLLEAWEAGDI